jgi:cell fate regulator YaaT (PSP1 superfamily)
LTEVISVRFRGGCKNYYFDPKGLQVKMGDQVIVETTQGAEFATCTEANHEVADEAIVQPLCVVLRMATENDRRTVEYNRKKESEASAYCGFLAFLVLVLIKNGFGFKIDFVR